MLWMKKFGVLIPFLVLYSVKVVPSSFERYDFAGCDWIRDIQCSSYFFIGLRIKKTICYHKWENWTVFSKCHIFCTLSSTFHPFPTTLFSYSIDMNMSNAPLLKIYICRITCVEITDIHVIGVAGNVKKHAFSARDFQASIASHLKLCAFQIICMRRMWTTVAFQRMGVGPTVQTEEEMCSLNLFPFILFLTLNKNVIWFLRLISLCLETW